MSTVTYTHQYNRISDKRAWARYNDQRRVDRKGREYLDLANRYTQAYEYWEWDCNYKTYLYIFFIYVQNIESLLSNKSLDSDSIQMA